MSTDADVRKRALNPRESFLVEAPAGSGKTELLIQRYLRLLGLVDKPESIVALTFTRKAAAEMKERVLGALRDAADEVPLENDYAAQTRQLANAALKRSAEQEWNILEDTRRLQIGTIDSFCSLLTRQMPLLSEFGSHPEILESPLELYRVAARRTLVTLAESENLQHIFHEITVHFDGDLSRLETLISNLLQKRDQWKRRLDFDRLSGLRDEIDEILREEQLRRLQRAAKDWPLDDPPCPAVSGESLADWLSTADFLLTKEGSPRKRKPFTDALLRNDEFCRTLHTCRQPIPPSVSDTQWELIWNFSALLSVALFQLNEVFREHRQVDFTQIAQAAVAALGTPESPTDLAFRLDYRIEHILVDEFQDTSLIQYELLERLTAQWSEDENRTLFLVGDPMQSIYRFRNAEVGLFLKAGQEGIGNVRLQRLTLTRNFRSQPQIVRWVNDTFGRIASAEDDARAGQVKVRPAEPARADPGPVPQLHPFLDDDDGEAEAGRVVELARAALQEPFDSAAILVRTRRQLAAILPALRRAHIPYEAVELDALTEEQHILDLLSLAKALHCLADRTSWLGCLRAPFCGLTLADLTTLAEDDPKRPIWDLLSDGERLARLSSDGRHRLSRFCAAMGEALKHFGHYPVRPLIEATWLTLGGAAALTEDNHREDAASFFALLEESDRGGFVPDFALLETRLHHLYAKPKKHDGPFVQVMTIHKSKGLEFDTVILPHLHGTTRASERDLLIWETSVGDGSDERFILAALPQSGLKDSPDKIYYDFVHRFSSEKDKAEQQRLFYVAVTRAKTSLHLLGSVGCTKSGESICKPSGGFLKLLWEAGTVEDSFQAELRRRGRETPTLGETPRVGGTPAAVLRRLGADWRLPVPEPALLWQPPYRLETEEQAAQPWASETSRCVGVVMHELLRYLAEEGITRWSEEESDALESFVDDELERAGVRKQDRPEAANRVLNAINRVLRSERGRWILASRPDARCEWALTGLIDGSLRSVRVDRTFTDGDGTRWIVDYKMSSHQGADLQSFLRREKQRYEAQLNAYAQLLLQTGETTVKVGLYFALLDQWLAWQVTATESVETVSEAGVL
jgi:ATP-dependent helicase/nuclease subunit A